MSYQDFCKAMELAPKCEDFYSRGGTTEAQIQKAEAMLGVQFSRQCREFYLKHNYISFSGYEIAGISPDSVFPLAGNAVATALADRKKWGLPEKWIPLLDEGFDDLVVYLDYSQLNVEGEPRIIEAVYTNGEHLDDFDDEGFEEGQEPEGYCRYMINEVLAEDFGAYMLSLIKEELEATASSATSDSVKSEKPGSDSKKEQLRRSRQTCNNWKKKLWPHSVI